ncbi:hypothetical protein ACLQ2Q_15735 [Microbacterium sp. DT81.1]|uniref:hypothetical protein n=1 Tax=Microbacterium sp. DT81.1 TaxID=3393413 RepID=UPI003CF46529
MAQSSGTIRDLGTLGGASSGAVAINAFGHVAGDSATAGGSTHAFRWTPSVGMQDLGTLGGETSVAAGMNARGQVIGASYTAHGEHRAFRWTASGGMEDIGTLGGDFTTVGAINNLGQVTGYSRLPNGNNRAFRWTPSHGIQDLVLSAAPAVPQGRSTIWDRSPGSPIPLTAHPTHSAGRPPEGCKTSAR